MQIIEIRKSGVISHSSFVILTKVSFWQKYTVMRQSHKETSQNIEKFWDALGHCIQ